MNIKLRNYNFNIHPGNNKDAWEYINTGNWEPHSFDILDTFVKQDAVVMDIGAWSGVLSLYIANKASTVYALDPDPVCYKELQRNILLNPNLAKKITAFPIAISNKKEILNLSARTEYGSSSSSILNRKRDTEHATQITTISLLDFLEQEQIEQVDFIKMDVEGAEFKILPTMKAALKRMKYPTLYVSFHYSFLIEHFYYDAIPSKFLNKVFLKLESITGLSLFKKKMKKEMATLFDAVMDYQYIYTTKGKLITKAFLKQHPDCIKNQDLVFTNTKWIS